MRAGSPPPRPARFGHLVLPRRRSPGAKAPPFAPTPVPRLPAPPQPGTHPQPRHKVVELIVDYCRPMGPCSSSAGTRRCPSVAWRAASRISVGYRGAAALAETFPGAAGSAAAGPAPGVEPAGLPWPRWPEAQLAGVDQLILGPAPARLVSFSSPTRTGQAETLVPPGLFPFQRPGRTRPGRPKAALRKTASRPQVAAGTKPVLVEAAPPPAGRSGPR